jgi:putative DNA methylase
LGSSFLESPGFPVDDVNEASAGEKQGGGRPEFWEMVFWWTRKPLAGARAVIAGALLPDGVSVYSFRSWLGLDRGVAHRVNPRLPEAYQRVFSKARLLDPFAGFGSIPLEAVRLGVGEVVAVELLPVAYVLLKAVLEYPKWASEKGVAGRLVKDVERWGNWVVEELRRDPDVRELYDSGVAVYIGTWEIRCPACGRYTPLVGNWWLARVAGRTREEEEEGEESEEEARRGEYTRLAWMEPVVEGGRVHVRIVDLNRELQRRTLRATINTREGVVRVDGREYRVQRPNIDARRETATCLHCSNRITGKPGEWPVKKGLRGWNESLERYLRGEISLEELKRQQVRPRLLAKVKIVEKDLEFEPATEEDEEKLWKALEKLRAMWGDPDIPTEPLAEYERRQLMVCTSTGACKWYQLFNPRQLLTLVKLVKLIREDGKKVEEEKLREGWSREDAYKYAEAITTYLAIALIRYADFNSIGSHWTITWLIPNETLAMRGIAMVWNYGEYSPYAPARTGNWLRNIENVVEGLSYLVPAVSSSSSKVRVLLDDATSLSKLGGEKFDLIVTDPPYRDDVPYAELSDFYYVWLKRALCDVVDVGGVLVRQPRFLREAFFDEFGSEIEVQWRVFAPREVSEAGGRSRIWSSTSIGGRSVPVGSFDYFKFLLSESFKAMASKLKDDGLLVTYYAHTSPEAWEALLEAARGAGFRLSSAHAMVTESAQRVTARGKAGLDISIVAVWRRGVGGEALASEVYARALGRCRGYAGELLKRGLDGVNLFVGVLGCVLSEFTGYSAIHGVRGVEHLVRDYVYPATAEAIAGALAGVEAEARFSPPALFYLLAKTLIEPRPRQATRVMDRSTLSILAIGTRSDMSELRGRLRLVEQDGERFRLLEPPRGRREPIESIRAVLEDRGVIQEARGVSVDRPIIRSSVDVLHVLEYYSLTLPQSELAKRAEDLRARHPAFYDEAFRLANVLSKLLKPGDPERELASRVSRSLSQPGPGRGLDAYLGGGLPWVS